MEETTPTDTTVQPEAVEEDHTAHTEPPAEAGQAADTQTQIAELRAELEREKAARLSLGRELQAAVTGYRSAVLAASPDLPADMVTGSTVREVEESAQRARRLVEQVRATVEAQMQGSRVPAGAPARAGVDVSGLSAREKIARGLQEWR